MCKNNYATKWREAAQLPQGVVPKIRKFARSVVLAGKASLSHAKPSSFLRGLYCHYVFDDQREDFARLMEELQSLGTFVDTVTCLAMLVGKREIDGPYFHLSFDDGFRNVFTNAIPCLRELKIPAILFVPSGLISADWEKVEHYCLTTAKYRAVVEMMSWEDLRETVALRFEVGSHTKTHARFSDISTDVTRMEDEIIGSKQDLEDQLQQECKYISWPFGRITDADERSLALTKAAGYEACFGAFRGSMTPGSTDLFAIPRHHFEPEWPAAHVKYFAHGNME